MFSKVEKEQLLDLLEELNERYSSDGCNDFSLPNTPENKEFLVAVAESSECAEEFEEEIEELRNSTEEEIGLPGGNQDVVHYFENKIKGEC